MDHFEFSSPCIVFHEAQLEHSKSDAEWLEFFSGTCSSALSFSADLCWVSPRLRNNRNTKGPHTNTPNTGTCETTFSALPITLLKLQVPTAVPLVSQVNLFYPGSHPVTFLCLPNETGLARKACAETSNLAEFSPKGLSVGPDSHLPCEIFCCCFITQS